jgi:hypothetical protein
MGDPVAAIGKLAAHVWQVHVKDAVPTDVPGTWGREVVAGTGAVDWVAFFAAVRALPRHVDLVIEREAGPTRDDAILKSCMAWLRASSAAMWAAPSSPLMLLNRCSRRRLCCSRLWPTVVVAATTLSRDNISNSPTIVNK